MTSDGTRAQASNLPKAAIETMAESMASLYGYKPARELPQVVENFGGKLAVRDYMNDPATGSIFIEGEGDFTIYIPLHTSVAEDRFTVAHELGHYVVHYLWPHRTNEPFTGPVYADRYGIDRAEHEANWFASAFLMPNASVRDVWQASGSVSQVAAVFRVTPSAAYDRLVRLELIEPDDTILTRSMPEPVASSADEGD